MFTPEMMEAVDKGGRSFKYVLENCGYPEWDGYHGVPLEEEAVKNAAYFYSMVPWLHGKAIFSANSDGMILLFEHPFEELTFHNNGNVDVCCYNNHILELDLREYAQFDEATITALLEIYTPESS